MRKSVTAVLADTFAMAPAERATLGITGHPRLGMPGRRRHLPRLAPMKTGSGIAIGNGLIAESGGIANGAAGMTAGVEQKAAPL